MYQLLSNRSVVELTGRDSLQFIQNLITNDVISKNYCYSYMLSNQGRYLFDFFIFKNSDQKFLIDICSSQSKEFVAKLLFYKLRAEIGVEINDDYSIIYSESSPAILTVYSYRDPRFEELGFRSVIRNFKNTNNIGIQNLYLCNKYKYAIPDGNYDLIHNKSIPLEYGAEELNAISFDKGCYIGQEFNSRTKYQGVIRKKIYKIIFTNEPTTLETGTEVKIGEISIGICCSHYKNLGIALIREEKYLEYKNDPITIGNNVVELVIPKWRQI